MLKLLFFVSICLISSCSSNNIIKDDNIEIVIQRAQSYQYDLQLKTYTVFNMKGDTTIQFHLSREEKRQIVDRYYRLGLGDLQGQQEIEDNCHIMPKLYTTLKVKSKEHPLEIIIDEDCRNYNGLFNKRGQNVAEFLQYVINLLKTKPEIKNAPFSDIMYL